jgi:hypothetical protein
MTFDLCQEEKTQIVLKAGAIIKQLKGLPEEKNITILYDETALLLGIAIKKISSLDADHLPAPNEMKTADGEPIIPLQKCPKCGKDSMEIFGLCHTCEDAKGENGEIGKYKTKFVCKKCSYSEKSEKYMVIWLQKMGIDFGNQSKKELGVKTITDDGIK